VDDYGLGSYQQLPTSGSTPTASRSQTPQPPNAGRDLLQLGNFQQSNSLVGFDGDSKGALIRAKRPTISPLPPMLLSTLAELRSRFVVKRKTSAATSFSPPPRSHTGSRQSVLPTIPEETTVDDININGVAAVRRADQFGIDSACLDSSCEELQQQYRCCDAADRSISDGDRRSANAPVSVSDQNVSDVELGDGGACGSCGSGTASSDELSSSSSSSSRKSCNANNSSAANRNNSSATSFSRRDAVMARLSQTAASWSSRFTFVPQQPKRFQTESHVRPATVVPSSSFRLQDPQQQRTPPVAVDDDGFQTVELFSAADDTPAASQRPQPNHQHQLPESRRQRVGPFNYVAGGSR
jgi:hypothetical protein